jgi:hypothetical protein
VNASEKKSLVSNHGIGVHEGRKMVKLLNLLEEEVDMIQHPDTMPITQLLNEERMDDNRIIGSLLTMNMRGLKKKNLQR